MADQPIPKSQRSSSAQPLISCIMPTTGSRKRFVEQSIAYFHAQDYLNAELIIVDEHDAYGDCVEVLTHDICYVWTMPDRKLSIGMKRNIAVSLAKGEIICHWDDDDYYGPQRLSKQAEPILAGKATMTAFSMSLLFNALDGTLWECPERVHDRLFPHGVRASTLMYQARVWRSACTYENTSKGEDVQFLRELLQWYDMGSPIVDPASYICVRHGGNVTPEMDVNGWQQVPLERYLSASEQAFYAQFSKDALCVVIEEPPQGGRQKS